MPSRKHALPLVLRQILNSGSYFIEIVACPLLKRLDAFQEHFREISKGAESENLNVSGRKKFEVGCIGYFQQELNCAKTRNTICFVRIGNLFIYVIVE